MKKILIIVIAVVLSIDLCLLGYSLLKTESSEYVSYEVTVGNDGTYKILQLTDLHFINSDVTDKDLSKDYSVRDGWAMTAITEIIKEANPDMLAVTGDVIFTLDSTSIFTGTNDNYEAFKKVAKFIDSFEIPWVFIFGNHDEEGSLRHRISAPAETGDKELDMTLHIKEVKKVLAAYLQSGEIKYCMFDNGPEDITGVGNYVVNVLNKDGSVNNSLMMLDSGSYIYVYDAETDKLYPDQRKYEYVHGDQLDWYEAAIKDISRIEKRMVDSIIFQHIPFPTYQSVINSYIDALEKLGEKWEDTINSKWSYGTERKLTTSIGEIIYHGGICNEANHEVCSSYVGTYHGKTFDGGHEFERILSLGSTKYVFCGHDHRNTFSFTYQGVRLSYGMSIDYSANGIVPPPMADNQTIFDETEQRGGTLITLQKDSSVEIKQIPFTRNLYREALAAKGK